AGSEDDDEQRRRAYGGPAMSSQETLITTHSVETPSGRISYASAGSGPLALFVHGVVLNKHLWQHQLAGLSDIRSYCSAAIWMGKRDNQDGNPGSRHWHD